MGVLIIKNVANEGAGSLGAYLDGRGIAARTVEPDEVLAEKALAGYDILVVLGGPMGVYEMASYPHLGQAVRLIGEAIERGMKVLGVCLGAQLIAHVLGAEVAKGAAGVELGWRDITLTPEGARDPAFAAMDTGGLGAFPVLHWHGDTFTIPRGARLLAGSAQYPHQAFAYGAGVYALQFHIECTRGMIGEWFGGKPEWPAIADETERLYEAYSSRALRFYERFFAS